MEKINLNPKYAKRLNKYIHSKRITIDRDELDHALGDLLLLTRIKKRVGCPTLRDMNKYIRLK